MVAKLIQDFPGPLRMGCYKSCMGKSEPRKVHIAEIKSTRDGVTYTSVYQLTEATPVQRRIFELLTTRP
ncbi:MAG: hypothetical protein DWH78_00640 [Planctomycetota bacterium]|nr:MAG: hypothetical protein DWH78_00640 [Planctomycetota bacterium]